MPLTSTGFTISTFEDMESRIRRDLDAGLGVAVDYDRDKILGLLTSIQAQLNVEAQQLIQAIYDARTEEGASGIHLDDIANLAGRRRNRATRSQVELTLTGTGGTVIPLDARVRGGGEFGTDLWRPTEVHTIPASGTLTGSTWEAVEPGAVVASAGAITAVATPISGLSTVTNPDDAVTGVASETDAQLRERRRLALQGGSQSARDRILAELRDLDFITSATVLENNSHEQRTINGVSMSPSSIQVVVYPATIAGVDSQRISIWRTLFRHVPGSTRTLGDQAANVTTRSGQDLEMRFSIATELEATNQIQVDADPGYDASTLADQLADELEEYVDALEVGEALRFLEIYGIAAGIEGIQSIQIGGNETIPTATQKVVYNMTVS